VTTRAVGLAEPTSRKLSLTYGKLYPTYILANSAVVQYETNPAQTMEEHTENGIAIRQWKLIVSLGSTIMKDTCEKRDGFEN
jgi:hypothetical protein